MIVSLHFNWLPENALNLAYQVWLPDVDINFLDIKIDTTKYMLGKFKTRQPQTLFAYSKKT